MTALVTQANIEDRYDATQVRDAFCDDGSGTPGTSLVTAIATASKLASMILAKGGWGADEIVLLVAGDEAINAWVCDLAMYEGTKRKLAWLNDQGFPILTQVRKDALAGLEDVAAARKRPESEATAGANKTYRDRMNVVSTPQFMFAPSKAYPKPGGY